MLMLVIILTSLSLCFSGHAEPRKPFNLEYTPGAVKPQATEDLNDVHPLDKKSAKNQKWTLAPQYETQHTRKKSSKDSEAIRDEYKLIIGDEPGLSFNTYSERIDNH